MANKADIAIQLIKIARQGDRDAFRSFFDAYYQKLFHWAMYFTKSEQHSEDVVSEVFIKLWNNRQSLPDVLQLDNYLFTAVKRQSLNFISKRNKEVYFTSIEVDDDLKKSDDSNPEYQYMEQELDELIYQTIESLPPRCKLIFQMVRQDGMKYQQVADLLQISCKTVENQLLKATSILRDHICRYQQHEDMKLYLSNILKCLAIPFISLFL